MNASPNQIVTIVFQLLTKLAQVSHKDEQETLTKMKTDSLLQYERLSRMIESSSNLLQLETTEKLLELFRVKYHGHPELHEKLQVQFTGKARQAHYFEWKYYKDFDAEAA